MITTIENFPAYGITEDGVVFSKYKDKTNKLTDKWKRLRPILDTSSGYYTVTLVRGCDGKHINKRIHRLLMETFVPNPHNKSHVNHIDGNKLNNNLKNLEWATPKENSQHAVRTGLTTYEYCEKEVHQYTIGGDYITSYSSGKKAQLATSIPNQNISKCTTGKRPNAGGYRWSTDKVKKLGKYTGKPVLKEVHVLDTKNNTYIYLNSVKAAADLINVVPSTIHRNNGTKKLIHDRYIVTKIFYP